MNDDDMVQVRHFIQLDYRVHAWDELDNIKKSLDEHSPEDLASLLKHLPPESINHRVMIVE